MRVRWAAALGAVGVAVLAVGPGAVAHPTALPHAPAVVPASETELDEGVLDVQFVSVSPAPLTADSHFSLTVSVTNRTDAEQSGTVSLGAQSRSPSSRAGMLRWIDDDGPAASLDVATLDLAPLAPGESVDLSFQVPAEDFGYTSWGPRGIEVRSVPSGEAVGDAERSWVVWWDDPTVTPAPLLVLLPIAPTTDEITAGEDPARWTTLAEAGAQTGVTLLVDPSLLPDDGPAVDALRSADDVWTLPWGDADTEALRAAGRWDVVETLSERSEERLADLDITVAGAADRTIDPTAALAEVLTGPLLLSSSTVENWYQRGTPSGAVTLNGAPGVVLDELMQGALAGTVVLDSSVYEMSPLQARQFLAATTAAQVRENPGLARLLAVAVPADDDGTATALAADLTALPWISPTPLSDVDTLRHDAPDIADDVTLASPTPSPTAISARELDRADDALARWEALEPVVGPESSLRSEALDQLDLLPSRALRDVPDERAAMIENAEGASAELVSGLELTVPASLLMVSETSNFPVTVTNSLPDPATVLLRLEASDRRLRQAEPARLTLLPGEQTRAEIPVTAVGSGDLTAHVQLLTPEGDPIGDPQSLQVQMRADWEGFGISALVALGAISFVFGLWRTIRRNKRDDRAAEIKEAAEIYEAQLAVEEAEAES